MAGLFYDPRVHDWGTPLANALTQGVQTGMAALKFSQDMKESDLKIKAGEIELENKKNIQAAGNEIAGLAEKYSTDMKELQKTMQPGTLKTEAATTPQSPTPLSEAAPAVKAAIPGGGLAAKAVNVAGKVDPLDPEAVSADVALERAKALDPEAVMTPETPAALADVQKNRQAERTTKADVEFREKASALGGKFDKDIYLAYMKHKLPDKAKEHMEAHIKGAHSLASISPEVAYNYLKNGPMGEMFEGIKVESGKPGRYKIAMSDGSFMEYDSQTGKIIATGQTAGKKKAYASHFKEAMVTGNTTALMNFVTDPESGLVVAQQQVGAAGPRWKHGEGEGGDKKLKVGELTAVQKIVAQKYIPLAKDNARTEGMDPEQIDKIGTGNYYTYLNPTQRGSHDRVIIDAETIAKKKAPASAVDEALTIWHKTGGQAQPAAGGTRTNMDKTAKATADAQTAAAKKPKEIDVGGQKYVKITEDTAGNRWGYKADGSKVLIKKGSK